MKIFEEAYQKAIKENGCNGADNLMELTELQWAKKGFVLNMDAKGEEGWNNNYYRYRVIRFPESEVHEDIVAAKAIVSAKRKKYQDAAKKRKQKRKENVEYREKMKTRWQWLQEGRIPNDNARWEVGEELNKTFHTWTYGSNYCYCHERYTHKPKDDEELENAISESKREYAKLFNV